MNLTILQKAIQFAVDHSTDQDHDEYITLQTELSDIADSISSDRDNIGGDACVTIVDNYALFSLLDHIAYDDMGIVCVNNHIRARMEVGENVSYATIADDFRKQVRDNFGLASLTDAQIDNTGECVFDLWLENKGGHHSNGQYITESAFLLQKVYDLLTDICPDKTEKDIVETIGFGDYHATQLHHYLSYEED